MELVVSPAQLRSIRLRALLCSLALKLLPECRALARWLIVLNLSLAHLPRLYAAWILVAVLQPLSALRRQPLILVTWSLVRMVPGQRQQPIVLHPLLVRSPHLTSVGMDHVVNHPLIVLLLQVVPTRPSHTSAPTACALLNLTRLIAQHPLLLVPLTFLLSAWLMAAVCLPSPAVLTPMPAARVAGLARPVLVSSALMALAALT
jgi:hypothetical protein